MMYSREMLLKNIENNKSVNSISMLIENSALYGNRKRLHYEDIFRSIFSSFLDTESNINESDVDSLISKLNGSIITENMNIDHIDFPDNPFINEKKEEISQMIKVKKRKRSLENNHVKIQEKLKENNIIDESMMYSSDNFKDSLYDIVKCIDESYPDIKDIKKATICMEYLDGISKSSSKFGLNSKDILNIVSEYFYLTRENNEFINESINNLLLIEEKYIKSFKKDIERINNYNKPVQICEGFEVIYEGSSIINTLKSFQTSLLRKANKASYKATNSAFNNKITKMLYTKTPDDIIAETPSILAVVRRIILYGTTIIVNPYLLVPVMIADGLMHQKVTTRACNDQIDSYNKEKRILQKKLDRTKDEETRKVLENYIKSIDKAIDKIEAYKESINKEIEITDESTFEYNASVILYLESLMFAEEIVTEGTAANVVRRAKEKLSKATGIVSAKEKAASKVLDSSLEKIQLNMEKAVALENKEKVIKGHILPPASKCIKLAVATGAVWMINPVLAIIGSLGAMAVGNKVRLREKQMILDEIDVHLKIVEKKVKQAELNNDDESLETLLKLENKLKREKQRIKYNIRVTS